jgi:phage tail sheath protein FI
VTDLANGLGLLAGTATQPLNEALSGGNDDPYTASTIYSAFVPGPATRGGIYALETVDIFNLMVLAGVTDSSTLIDAAAYCVSRRAFLIVDSDPAASTPDKLAALVQGAGVPKSDSAAIYGPWIKIGDPLNGGKLRKTAPSGSLAGLFARIDSSRGVWKAPAGTEANIVGAQGLDYVLTDGENGSLNPLGFNALRLFPVYGVVSWGARTLMGSDAAASEYKYVPVRRLALYLEESLYRGTQWVVFEPNDEPLWAQIRLNIGAFMQTLFRQGAFQGQTPSQAYFVKCDSETTTQNDINLGIVNIVVGFAPLKPAEFVIIQLQQMAGQIAV